MYGGLSRPTALDSDSPFAIASHALHDKSTPSAPALKIPTRRAGGSGGSGGGGGGVSPGNSHGGGGHVGGGGVNAPLQAQQQQQQQHQHPHQQQSYGGHQPYPPPSNSSSSRHPGPPPAPPSAQQPRPHPHPHGALNSASPSSQFPMNPHPSQHHHQQPPPLHIHPPPPGSGPSHPQAGAGGGGMQSPGGGGGGGFGLREGARDAYMGAGAYDSRTGRYGPPLGVHQQQQPQQPQQPQQGYYPQQSPQGQTGYRAQAGFVQGQVGYGGGVSGARSPVPTPAQLQSQHQQQQQQQQHHQPNAPYPLTERTSAHSPRPQSPYNTYTTSPAPTSSTSGYTPSPAQLSASAAAAAGIGSPQSSSGGMYGTPQGGPGAGGAGVIDPNQLSLQPRVDRRGQGRSGSKDSSTGQELWEMFSSMDIRRTGQLGNKEVMELLSRDSRWRITPREDCVKMLMSIFDSDRSGFISFVEFEGLWAYIKDWHKIFLRFDRDNSGTIDRGELDQALQSFGYPLPRDLVRKLEKRFAPPKESEGSVPRGITFDRFLMACVTVKHFTEAFRRRDVRNEGRLTIDYNTFMDLVIDAPV